MSCSEEEPITLELVNMTGCAESLADFEATYSEYNPDIVWMDILRLGS